MNVKKNIILEREKILVVDDLPKWLNVARNNLTYYGCENIITAETPNEAFEKYQEQIPSIIMTDINFNIETPESTEGLDLISKLRKNGYEYPLIAMSSLTGNIDQRAIGKGADYFINKKNFTEGFDGFIEWYREKLK